MLAQKAEINYDKTVLNANQVVSYINSLGFECRIIEDDAASNNKIELHVSLKTFNQWFSQVCFELYNNFELRKSSFCKFLLKAKVFDREEFSSQCSGLNSDCKISYVSTRTRVLVSIEVNLGARLLFMTEQEKN